MDKSTILDRNTQEPAVPGKLPPIHRKLNTALNRSQLRFHRPIIAQQSAQVVKMQSYRVLLGYVRFQIQLSEVWQD